MRRLVDLGVHHVTVSLWAGTREAYAATHPGTEPEVFDEVTDRLRALNERKVDRPTTKLYHVLTTANSGDVGAMLDLAADLRCDAVELAVADVVRPWTSRAPWRRPRLLGLHALIARLEALAQGRPADADLVHAIPCFAGWTYARVMADGRVIPCLKAHRVPSGNVHDEPFAAIWGGARQQAFRRATRAARKAGPLFAQIGNDDGAACGCERGCDNLEENRRTADRLGSLTLPERLLLRHYGRIPA